MAGPLSPSLRWRRLNHGDGTKRTVRDDSQNPENLICDVCDMSALCEISSGRGTGVCVRSGNQNTRRSQKKAGKMLPFAIHQQDFLSASLLRISIRMKPNRRRIEP